MSTWLPHESRRTRFFLFYLTQRVELRCGSCCYTTTLSQHGEPCAAANLRTFLLLGLTPLDVSRSVGRSRSSRSPHPLDFPLSKASSSPTLHSAPLLSRSHSERGLRVVASSASRSSCLRRVGLFDSLFGVTQTRKKCRVEIWS